MADARLIAAQPENSLRAPAYPVAEAGRLVGLAPGRVRRWLQGYEFTYETKSRPHLRRSKKGPVVDSVSTPSAKYASFLDLIDLQLVRELLRLEFSLQTIRRAFDEIRRRRNITHLAYESLFTMGKRIFLEFGELGESMLGLLTGGQMAFPQVITQLGRQIEFDRDTRIAIRWYPLHPDRLVVIDPHISFGHPTITGRRITTSAVVDLYHAEGEEASPVCEWLGVSPAEVASAIRFEKTLSM